MPTSVENTFFDQPATELAQALLGKVICRRYEDDWLYAQIIETEAYELTDRASHASLGFTHKRRALFMPAGTIYMYYARGKDSFNISARGAGCAVLLKSAIPFRKDERFETMIEKMHRLNPKGDMQRPMLNLLSGQTLLCRSLDLRVVDWDAKTFVPQELFIGQTSYVPREIIATTRLGIPLGRDEHLPYRFVDMAYNAYCTKPVKKV